jgi:hypothetical protein
LNIIYRNYLWLKIILEVIAQSLAVTKTKLQRIVGMIPKSLDEAYEAMLEKSAD